MDVPIVPLLQFWLRIHVGRCRTRVRARGCTGAHRAPRAARREGYTIFINNRFTMSVPHHREFPVASGSRLFLVVRGGAAARAVHA